MNSASDKASTSSASQVLYLGDGTTVLIDPNGRLVGILSNRDLLQDTDILERARAAIDGATELQHPPTRHADTLESLASLTSREREVMGLMLAGKHAKQIAYELQVSGKTVDFHRRNILEKFAVEDAPQLMRVIFELQVNCLDLAIS